MNTSDFAVSDEGTIVLLTPLSINAKAWLNENVDSSAMYFGLSLVVEHRYAQAILDGIGDAGFTISA